MHTLFSKPVETEGRFLRGSKAKKYDGKECHITLGTTKDLLGRALIMSLPEFSVTVAVVTPHTHAHSQTQR